MAEEKIMVEIAPQVSTANISVPQIAMGVAGGNVALQALSQVLETITWALKPVINILRGIGKILGTFLAPIAEVLTILLRPVLVLLKPIVQVFFNMLRPLMNTLRQLGNITAAQVASGDVQGGIKTSMHIASLAFGGIAVAFTNVMLNSLVGVIDNMVQMVLKGIIDITAEIAKLIPMIDKDKVDEAAANLKQSIETMLDPTPVQEAVSGWSESAMQTLIQKAEDKLAELKGTLDIKLPEIIEPQQEVPKKILESLQDPETGLPKVVGEHEKAGKDILTETKNKFDPKTIGSVPNVYATGLLAIQNATESFKNDLAKKASEIKSLLASARSNASKIEMNLLKFEPHIEVHTGTD